jgi:hypothetical protein
VPFRNERHYYHRANLLEDNSFSCYIIFMTVTVEVKNQQTLDLLKSIEGVRLIRVNSPIQARPAPKMAQGETPPYHWLRGCCKGMGGSVDDFLARCREDKAHELEIERRQEEERARRAGKRT